MGQVTQWLGWIDPLTLAFVLLGSIVIAATRGRKGEVAAAFVALKPLLCNDPLADAHAAMRAVRRIAAVAEAKSIGCADRVSTTGAFLAEAARQLAIADSSPGFVAWAEADLDARDRRHRGVIAFWSTMADAAPAMGMIATVLGLVRMFAHMDDPHAIGAPMASALLATLVGLLLANIVAGPIAARLERLHDDERAWQSSVFDHLIALARAELDQAEALQRRLRQSFG